MANQPMSFLSDGEGAALYAQTPPFYGSTGMHRLKLQPLILGIVVTVLALAIPRRWLRPPAATPAHSGRP